MKIIHADGFTHSELSSFRPTVLDNLLASMKYVLSGMGILRINLECSRNKVAQHFHNFNLGLQIKTISDSCPSGFIK